ncbi:MAG: hypothetical protein FWD11_07645 [Micrococcales bacterium]|nr:hypothetical protein [Micrococcales bacterium]
MKSASARAISVTGAFLVAAGTLVGCSDGGGSGATFCDLANQLVTMDDTADFDAFLKFWRAWRDSAPPEIKDDFDTVIDFYRDSAAGKTADEQAYSEALEAIFTKASECPPPTE